MGTIAPFPTRLRSVPPTFAAPPVRTLPVAARANEYALGDVARELKMSHRPVRAIVEALRALARHEGMPLPRTPRIVKGLPKRGADSICKDSRWDAGEYDAWLLGRGPSGPAAIAVAPPLRDEMRRRAEAIAA